MTWDEIKLALFLSFRFLTRSKITSLILIILIISAAFTNVVFVFSFFEGVLERVDLNIKEYLTSDIKIEPKEDGELISDVRNLKNKILSIDGVSGVTSFYHIPASVTYKNITRFFDLRTVSDEDEAAGIKLKDTLVIGEFLEKLDRDKVVIGKDVAGKYGSYLKDYSLKTDVGKKIKVHFSNGIEKEYQVKGILDAKNYDVDLEIFIREEEIENVLGVRDKASAILIKVNDPAKINRVRRDIMNLDIGENVYPWWKKRALSMSLSSSFSMLKIIVGAISTIAAAFSIISVLFLNLIQKRKHIGLMKAIGVNKRSIIISYIFQSIFYCLAGVSIGVFILLFIMKPYFSNNAIEFPIGMVTPVFKIKFIILSFVIFIVVSALSGFLPSSALLKKKTIDLLIGERM